MRKLLKWTGIVILSLIAIGTIAVWLASEPLPEGKAGPAAEALAQKIMQATGQTAWDSTRYVRWDFAGRHQLIWDRERNLVQVEWSSYKVLLNTQNQMGQAWKDGILLEGNKAQKKLAAAWKYFCNDSFWLNAPGKLYDPGTTRKLVKLEDGTEGLLITYDSGGVTPRDSYLWIADPSGLPLRWKMWVHILPVGGLEASWENWQQLSGGGMVATRHDLGFYQLELSGIQAGNHWGEVGLSEDPFGKIF